MKLLRYFSKLNSLGTMCRAILRRQTIISSVIGSADWGDNLQQINEVTIGCFVAPGSLRNVHFVFWF